MRYLTARKRAEGKGAAHTGTEHHWHMTVTAVALAFLVPTWLYVFGHALGQPYEAVRATFARPFPAILTALILIVGMRHFAMGAQMMIEDYARGTARKMAVIFVYSLSAVVVATGLFALIKIAL
ncbi:succinate dehydrogenase, hydrophobic membrane anchor protein [Fuscibacter oryzae]|uniref:Succinate dehydrogenase hydrophobic membrane anchor subunit n=1 Tax=Fuscibacter oryzae TaxID=2803939 RepID=A0A8J7SWM3_9RHOB|nr:succinate dehydrogenase, hydrophobic membrane anchor protein [Fuscibacter oryzae]MBL4929821.1 succinate dehydrogenase, hydrophobic membrane anchor protein [Fuscibacter oryzae]